jgi:hypothetical protein
MPLQPTPASLHIDQLLTNISISYQNPEYIVDKIFPIVPVNKQSNKIPKYDQSHWFRDEARLRTPGTKSQRGGFSVDTSATYFCDRYSYGFEIADEQRDNQDAPYNMDRDGTEFATDKVLMRREVSFAGKYFTTGQWGSADKTGGTDFTKWSDYGGSQPLVDIANFKDGVEAVIGREPNMGVLGKLVQLQLRWHPDIVDLIKYTAGSAAPAKPTTETIANVFDLQALLVGRAIYTTSPEGTAETSVTYTRVWGKNMLLLYTPARPSLLTPAAGYCFVWQRVDSALTYVKRMRDEEREVDVLEANTYFTHAQTAKNAGVFLSNAVA